MTRNLIKTDASGYMKDEKTGVIINTNYNEYEKYVLQKNQHKEYLRTKEELSEVKTQIEELKRLLLEKINNG